MARRRERRPRRRARAPATAVAPTPAPAPEPIGELAERIPEFRVLRVFEASGRGPLADSALLLGIDGRFREEWLYRTDHEGFLHDGGCVQARLHYFLEGATKGELAQRLAPAAHQESFLLFMEKIEKGASARSCAREAIKRGIVEARCSLLEAATPFERDGDFLSLRPQILTSLPHQCRLADLRRDLQGFRRRRGEIQRSVRAALADLTWLQALVCSYAARAANFDAKNQWKTLVSILPGLGPTEKLPRGAPDRLTEAVGQAIAAIRSAVAELEEAAEAIVELLRAAGTRRCLLAHRVASDVMSFFDLFSELALTSAGERFFRDDLVPALLDAFVPGRGRAPTAVTAKDLENPPDSPTAWSLIIGSAGDEAPDMAARLLDLFALPLSRDRDLWPQLAKRWWNAEVHQNVDLPVSGRNALDLALKTTGQLKKTGLVGWGTATPERWADVSQRLSERLAGEIEPLFQHFQSRGGPPASRLGKKLQVFCVSAALVAGQELRSSWAVARRLPGLARFGAGLAFSVAFHRRKGPAAKAGQIVALDRVGEGSLADFDRKSEALDGELGRELHLDMFELARTAMGEGRHPLARLMLQAIWAEASLFCARDAELLTATPWTGSGAREDWSKNLAREL